MMSDAELAGEVYLALLLLEANRPFKNWEDFGSWYRGEEASHEADRAAYFYRNKIPLELQLQADDEACEPTWLSDGGAGAECVYGFYRSDKPRRRGIFTVSAKGRRRRARSSTRAPLGLLNPSLRKVDH